MQLSEDVNRCALMKDVTVQRAFMSLRIGCDKARYFTQTPSALEPPKVFLELLQFARVFLVLRFGRPGLLKFLRWHLPRIFGITPLKKLSCLCHCEWHRSAANDLYLNTNACEYGLQMANRKYNISAFAAICENVFCIRSDTSMYE